MPVMGSGTTADDLAGPILGVVLFFFTVMFLFFILPEIVYVNTTTLEKRMADMLTKVEKLRKEIVYRENFAEKYLRDLDDKKLEGVNDAILREFQEKEFNGGQRREIFHARKSACIRFHDSSVERYNKMAKEASQEQLRGLPKFLRYHPAWQILGDGELEKGETSESVNR